MKTKQPLQYCSNCKEKSMIIKAYTTKAGNRNRVQFCINKGCGYKVNIEINKKGE